MATNTLPVSADGRAALGRGCHAKAGAAPHLRHRNQPSPRDSRLTRATRARVLLNWLMLMGRVAIPRDHGQTAAINGLESNGNSGSHAPDLHAASRNPFQDSNVRFDPLAAAAIPIFAPP